jgi:hypothetical protein
MKGILSKREPQPGALPGIAFLTKSISGWLQTWLAMSSIEPG